MLYCWYQATNSADFSTTRSMVVRRLLVAGSFVLLGLLANPEIHARSVFARLDNRQPRHGNLLLYAEHYGCSFCSNIDRILELKR